MRLFERGGEQGFFERFEKAGELFEQGKYEKARALYERFGSRGEDDYANRLMSAMRFEFGGHYEKGEKA